MFFSWAAFAFAGAAAGFLLVEARQSGNEHRLLLRFGAGGVTAFWAGDFINRFPGLHYGYFDYSRTSPQYFLVRLGYVLIILYLSYLWTQRTDAPRWSPMLAFGQTSLLVYWLHIEVVYGRIRPFANSLGIGMTALQLLWIVPLMLLASVIRLQWLGNQRPAVTYSSSPRRRPSSPAEGHS